jgi:hypothetical protein
MPQVFGADQIGLMSVASLWAEAAGMSGERFAALVAEDDRHIRGAGFGDAAPVQLRKPAGEFLTMPLNSTKTHFIHAVWHVANRGANPGEIPSTQMNQGKKMPGGGPRYSVSIHLVPRNKDARGEAGRYVEVPIGSYTRAHEFTRSPEFAQYIKPHQSEMFRD